MLVAFLLWLLEDDQLRAKIELCNRQILRPGCPELRWEDEHHIHLSRWLLIGFRLLGAPFFPCRAPLHPLLTPDLFRKIWMCLPQHVKVLRLCFFEAAQALDPALLRMAKTIRTPPWAMVLVFLFFRLEITPGWPLNAVIMTHCRPQPPED